MNEFIILSIIFVIFIFSFIFKSLNNKYNKIDVIFSTVVSIIGLFTINSLNNKFNELVKLNIENKKLPKKYDYYINRIYKNKNIQEAIEKTKIDVKNYYK